jgi:hypothetical protein
MSSSDRLPWTRELVTKVRPDWEADRGHRSGGDVLVRAAAERG